MTAIKTCPRCGSDFKSRMPKQRYCSAGCRMAVARERRLTVCAQCGQEFGRPPSHRKRRAGPDYCSRKCAGLAKRKTLTDRLWSKVEKGDDCWLFMGDRHEHGYGRLWTPAGEPPIYAHRLAYEEASGAPIPYGMDVLHTCDNPPCCRNDCVGIYVLNGVEHLRWGHLFLGTQSENSSDRDAKDRVRHGDAHPSAKLTVEKVRRIRTLHATGAISESDLGRLFNVSQRTVHDAVSLKTWKRV